jgi:hypothetical protein
MGSGKLIKAAIRKYGKENFTKEILHICSSLEELNQRERELVTAEVLKDPLSYNIALGGGGGWLGNDLMLPVMKSQAYRTKMSEAINKPEVKSRMVATLKNTMAKPEWKLRFSLKQKESQNKPERRIQNSKTQKEAQSRPEVIEAKAKKMQCLYQDASFRRKHKNACNRQEFRQAQAKTRLGTKWIHNSTGDKKYVPVDELPVYYQQGWLPGMGPRTKTE